MRAELAAAFLLLTRLPAGWRASRPDLPAPGRDLWAYPVVGAVVGGIGACAFALGRVLGFHPTLAAIWTLACLVLLTGGLHEDGLADTADGFGGSSAARKLEIMRDSRIGSYGALALLLSTASRAAALALLADPLRVAAALIASGALSRGGMSVPILLLGPARPDGLAAGLSGRRGGQVVLCLLLAAAPPLLLLRPALAGAAIAASFVTAFAVAAVARRQVGGYTGDVLGACAVSIECVVLAILASAPA